MNATAATRPVRRVGARVWGGIVAAWAAVAGVAPHVLHHVGPLAGAAVLAGAGGKAIFFAIGLLLSVPMLRRLYRRFGTLGAPAVAIALFADIFTFSSLVIAPRLTGSEQSKQPGIQQPASSDHASHHSGGGQVNDSGYGLWFLVVFNSALFILFAASFFHPKSKCDSPSLGCSASAPPPASSSGERLAPLSPCRSARDLLYPIRVS